MAYDNNSGEGENNKTPYDLRQIYAKLVGYHLQDIYANKKINSFEGWFEALKELYTVTRFKYTEEDKAIELFFKERDKVSLVANKYAYAWSGKGKDPIQVAAIKNALRELEMWIYECMQNGGVYGKGYEYDEDEV